MTATVQALPLIETVTPADQAAVAKVVRRAVETSTPVYPVGGGTSLDYGVHPSTPGIGLSTSEVNRVIDYPADDMTITVEAGITMAQLSDRLAAKGQWLPVDVPQPGRATIGGAVAANLSGPRRYAYGTWRDYLLGFSAVDGLAAAFSGGGRVVKNAAGYNLCRLMVGSLGTLGVITQVTLMVRPLPETSAMVACDVPDFDAAERLLAGLVHTPTRPAAVELLSGPNWQHNPVMGPMLESSVAQLVVGFEGSAAEVEWMVQQISSEWRQLGAASLVTVAADEAALLWGWLTELPADVQISVPPSAAVETIERLRGLDPNGSIQAHAGDGVIRVHLSPRVPQQFAALLSEQLRPVAEAAGGNLVVLANPEGAALTGRDVWGPVLEDGAGDGAAVMRAMKDRFDPHGLLNPGRFVF